MHNRGENRQRNIHTVEKEERKAPVTTCCLPPALHNELHTVQRQPGQIEKRGDKAAPVPSEGGMKEVVRQLQ